MGLNTMSVQEIVQAFEELSPEEQQQVMEAMARIMQRRTTEPGEPRKRRSILEFMGAGAHAYDGTDAQEQMRQLRGEWDDEPEV